MEGGEKADLVGIDGSGGLEGREMSVEGDLVGFDGNYSETAGDEPFHDGNEPGDSDGLEGSDGGAATAVKKKKKRKLEVLGLQLKHICVLRRWPR